MNIKDTILSDSVNQWVFSQPGRIYIVGGYIRDLLMGVSSADKDFVSADNIEAIARAAAEKFKGTFIVLKDNLTYRVALKNRAFLDFTYMDSAIEQDLMLRDYTINAIAWSPETGILDLASGVNDLKRGNIKLVRTQNILEDPLRILRAYRLSAQLRFKIENNTRKILKKYSTHLQNVSPERITYELFRLLNSEITHKYLKLCLNDNVLHEVINIPHRRLSKNLEYIKKYDSSLIKLYSNKIGNMSKSTISAIISRQISQGLNASGMSRLCLLLFGAKSGSVNNSLIISTILKSRIKNMHTALNLATGRISRIRLYEIFKSARDCEYEIILLISLILNKNVDKYINNAAEYLNIRKRPALDGNDISSITGIYTGPRIGEIKEEIMRRQFIGEIKNRIDAQKWIIANLT